MKCPWPSPIGKDSLQLYADRNAVSVTVAERFVSQMVFTVVAHAGDFQIHGLSKNFRIKIKSSSVSKSSKRRVGNMTDRLANAELVTSPSDPPVQAPQGYLTKYPGYWHGPVTSQGEVAHIKAQLIRSEQECTRLASDYRKLITQYRSLQVRHAPFEKFETKSWKHFVQEAETIYRSRTKGK